MSKINFIETVVELDSGLQVRLSGEYEPIREFLDKMGKDFVEEEVEEDDIEHFVNERDCSTWLRGMLVEAAVDCAGGFSSISEGERGVVNHTTPHGIWIDFPSNGPSYFVSGEIERGEVRLG